MPDASRPGPLPSTRLSVAALLAFIVMSPAPIAAAAPISPAAKPDLAALQLQLFKATAVEAMRVKRLSNIGRLCHLVSAEDDAKIRANAQATVDDERSLLAPRDNGFADAYIEGLQDGAFRVADLIAEINDANCQRFAAPNGPLEKIMTWKRR